MKNISKYIMIAGVAAVLLNACAKDENKDSYGLPKVTTHPVFTFEGGNFVVETVREGAWTDPGSTAHVADRLVDITSEGSVDPSTPGLYPIIYSAFDETGMFLSSAERKVLIVSAPLTADYTGKYKIVHATRTNTIDVTSLGGETLGWYGASDSWFQQYAIPVEFLDLGTGLMVPPGNSVFGPFEGTVTYDDATKKLTFKLKITEGGNAGIAWTTEWIKQ